MCQGAQAGSADQDTGTGFEGDVWARCFQKDSDKDYAVVTFYVVAIACLLAWAFIRPYMTSWVQVCVCSFFVLCPFLYPSPSRLILVRILAPTYGLFVPDLLR